MSGALVGSRIAAADPRQEQGTIACTRYNVAGVPLPASMLRQPIHFAPGAIPIWLPPPSSPIMVPVV